MSSKKVNFLSESGSYFENTFFVLQVRLEYQNLASTV